jgi:hypothetical protein
MDDLAVVGSADQLERVRRLCAELRVRRYTSLREVLGDRPIVVIGDPGSTPDDPRVAYVARPAIDDRSLHQLITAVVARRAIYAAAPGEARTTDDARLAERAFLASRRLLAATDPRSTETTLGNTVLDIVDADWTQCLYHDARDGALWSEERRRRDGDARRAIAGISGWCAHTGAAVSASRAGDDPRWAPAIDDPRAARPGQLLAQPVVGRDGRVQAVLVAVRSARRLRFSDEDLQIMARFAGYVAPLVDQLSEHLTYRAMLARATLRGPGREPGRPVFRREALEAARLPRWGSVLRLSPPWVSWAYWLVIVLVVGGGLVLSELRVSSYATGRAVLRGMSRVPVTASTHGRIYSVDVIPGDAVSDGAVIARFYATGRDAARDPLVIRAPASGTISDLRATVGGELAAGDLVATVVDDRAQFELIAALPAKDLPALEVGMPLWFDVAGCRAERMVVTAVSAAPVSVSELGSLSGTPLEAAVAGARSVAIVRARPPVLAPSTSCAFVRRDRVIGAARVRVGTERAISAILPKGF